ncbi:5-amino-6-(5-phospho-D-ribitylamino)uracil phosphatase YitU [Austwickia sp. TVS 96-490-7B]|nr:5-amino-6-(5-phospho-D-ribitylamino)uracil phosphatase YitU [Austwickia sp. TVS 96-490-7B]
MGRTGHSITVGHDGRSDTAERAELIARTDRPYCPTVLPTATGRHLVALDIDGTILRHDGTLSPRVSRAVRSCVSAGHEVVIATGRSLLAAIPVVRKLGLRRGYLVCSNGAVLAEIDPQRPLGARLLLTHTFDAAPALTRLRDAWPGAQIAVEEVGVGFKVSAPFAPGELDGRIRVVDWDELVAGPATRVTFRSDTGTAQDFITLASRLGLHGVNYAVGFTAWLDIAPDGVSKASALQEVRRRLGINDRRTVAAGDQRNDLEMLAWAQCGVAMGNAPAEVRAAADYVTGTVDEDGLVRVLRAVPSARARRRCA